MAQLSKTVMAELVRKRDDAVLARNPEKVKYYQQQIDKLRELIERAK